MNEQEFILLLEEYLEGSLTPQGRIALKTEVLNNPARRTLFENQARQHVRLHAQSSRIDFSETQRIALMVMDIADKQKEPNAFMELIRKKSLRERFSLIIKGLRAAPDTVAHKIAKEEVIRIFGPVSLSVAVNVAVLLLLFWVPYALPPSTPTRNELSREEEGIMISLGSPDPLTPITPPETPPDNTKPDGMTSTPQIPSPSLTPSQNTGKAGTDGDSIAVTQPSSREEVSCDASLAPPLSFRTLPVGISFAPQENRSAKNRANTLISQKAEKTEIAVLKALQWLKTGQSTVGHWPGQDATAMTGLALLTFLAHGETPSSPEFGDTVTRGLQYLLKRQNKQGAFSQNVYAHAIATYAIAEAYTMTRIMELKAPLEKATGVIINGQQSNGGFDYDYAKKARFDTSVTGWQIQALKAARTAIPDMEGLDAALDRSTRFLLSDAVASDGSGFVYEGKNGNIPLNGGKQSMTGVGTLCLLMLGKNNSAPVRIGLRLLQNTELEWPATGKANVYAYYYISQAKFQSGNQTDWMRWNLRMQKVLIARQHKDGHWEQGDYDAGSNVYTTTLCTLMLEVYYRYLPSYAHRTETKPARKSASGDVHIDVL